MGRNQHIRRTQGWTAQKAYHYRGVIPVFAVKGQLDHVPKLQLADGGVQGNRARALRLPGHEAVEVLYSRPGGRFVVGVDVVPAEVLLVVHHAASGVDALGGKVGAVSPNVLVVVKRRVPAIGPAAGVPHCRGAVIGKQAPAICFVHNQITPSAQYMRER